MIILGPERESFRRGPQPQNYILGHGSRDFDKLYRMHPVVYRTLDYLYVDGHNIDNLILIKFKKSVETFSLNKTA
jgi:hypothetical protein